MYRTQVEAVEADRQYDCETCCSQGASGSASVLAAHIATTTVIVEGRQDENFARASDSGRFWLSNVQQAGWQCNRATFWGWPTGTGSCRGCAGRTEPGPRASLSGQMVT
jgi:hypothetical protein